MRIFAYILIACIALAVLRLVIVVLLIAYLLLLLLSLIFKPRETVGFLLFGSMATFAASFPGIFTGALIITMMVTLIGKGMVTADSSDPLYHDANY